MSSCQQHKHCIETAVKQAELICDESNSRLTSLRKKVLELVWAEHKPMKAYDMLSQLQKEDSSAKPPTVYRALDFLLEHGLVHKIHRLNAYVGCIDPNEDRPCCFMICTKCHTVVESHDEAYNTLINNISKMHKFKPYHSSFEIEGLCCNCV
jgi:Fur family zinc uptake transcriptional regulator